MNKLLKKIYASSVILALFANQFVPTMVNAQETTNSQNTATTAVTPTTSNGVTTQETTTSDSNAENTSAATVGIAQIGKVKVTATNTTGEAPQYTTANRQGTISLDGARVEQPVIGGYIEIKYPVEYIDSFSVAKGGPVERTDNSTPGVLKVYLSDITQTTSGSFPFTFKFKDRVTPEGYSFTPEISLKSSTGETLSPSLNDLKYTVKVDKQSLFKYDGPNDSQIYTADNKELYGGSATNNGITNPSDVPFKFSLSTNTGGGGQTQNWGNGRAQTRAVKTITVTDTLPTYTKVDGSTGTAVFDPAKNPGWTLNADGTVSTTVAGGDELIQFNTEAENALRRLTLLLSFPDAKVKTNIVNNAKTELSFVNQSDTEENLILNDGIQFKLIGELISDGATSKSNNDSQTLKVDEGAPDSAVSNWNLTFTNTAPNAVSELTLIDDTLDSRMYYYAVGVPFQNAPFDYDVYGVKADGSEVLLGSVEKGTNKQVIVDQEAYDAITAQAKQIYAGTLDKANASRVNRTYQSIKIKLKDGRTISPYERTSVYVQTKLLNPFNETERENPIRYENSFHAEGLVDGFGENGKFVTKPKMSFENLRYIEETIQLNKSTRSNPQGVLGEVVQYSISMRFDGLSENRRINGGKIIDVLPEGITYESYYINKQEQKNMLKKEPYVIEDYNGSGRQAVIFELKDLDFYNDKTIDCQFSPIVSAKITSDAMPTSIQNPDDYKKNTDNHAYFTANDFSPLPGKVKSPSLVDNVFKVPNTDGTVSDKIIGAKTKTLVNLPTEIRSEKFISTSDGKWTKEKVLTNYDQEFKYQLQTKNYSIATIKTFTLYDRLPYAGDEKGSNFTPFLTKALETDPKFTVYYNTAKDLPSDPYTATQAAGWVKADAVTDFTKVTAIKILLNEGESIVPGEIVNFVLNMKNPSYTDGSIDTMIANNSFYTNRDANNPKALGETNVVSNQLPQYIPVEKKWVGDRDASVSKIKVELFRTSDPSKVLNTLELNETNDWKGIFKLTTDGKLLDPSVKDYTVREVLEEQYGQDYTTAISGDVLGNDGVTITNTRNTVSHTVTKVWKDNNNKLSLRKGIKVQLKQNGKNYGTPIELNENNQWTYTFNELPDSLNGVKYVYSVDEVEVPEGYNHSISNEGTKTVITNTILDPIKKDLSFKKELQGRTLQEGEFTFNLLDEKGNVVQTVTNSADGTIQFTNLLFEKPGTYTFKVKEVSGTDSRITYDNSEKEATVVVTQEGKALIADIQYGKDITFTNVFTEPTTTATTQETTPTTENSQGLPNTGTSSLMNVVLTAMILFLSGISLVVFSKKEIN